MKYILWPIVIAITLMFYVAVSGIKGAADAGRCSAAYALYQTPQNPWQDLLIAGRGQEAAKSRMDMYAKPFGFIARTPLSWLTNKLAADCAAIAPVQFLPVLPPEQDLPRPAAARVDVCWQLLAGNDQTMQQYAKQIEQLTAASRLLNSGTAANREADAFVAALGYPPPSDEAMAARQQYCLQLAAAME